MNRRIIALALVSALLLCGCNTDAISSGSRDEAQIELEKTISPDSKWINSSIPGAIDENTVVRAQDDFYTFVNKEAILSTSLDLDYGNFFFRGDDLVKKRKIMIVSGEEDPEANKEILIDIPKDYVEHDEDLVSRFVEAINDWDTRNSVGRKPLEQYIDAIANISDINQMTDYVLDRNGDNFTNDSLISMEVKTTKMDPTKYTVILGRTTNYLLEARDQYTNINEYGIKKSYIVEEEVKCALTDIGYSVADAQRILKKCYKFEGMLADASLPDKITEKAENIVSAEDLYSYEDVQRLQGNYPICTLMNLYGFDKSTEYCIPYTEFVKSVGEIYSESNLELIKAYYIVHTIHEAMCLLDKEAYDLALKYEKNAGWEFEVNLSDSEGDKRMIEINDEWDRILRKYVAKYMGEPLEIVYLARYCTPDDKEYLSKMTEDLVNYYIGMINDEDWMDEASKESAVKKLTMMKRHIVYPEYFSDYSDLVFEDSDTLVDMVKKAKKSNLYHMSQKAGKNVESDDWDISEMPSSEVNAYYLPKENAIYIFAGIMATGDVYDPQKPYEYNLGKIGAIIGHEISHGFDKNGICFDEYGRDLGWWRSATTMVYAERARRLEKFFDSIPAAPGLANLSGSKLENEAIADMGGIKATLAVAEGIPDFDYDLFFRSFAVLWSEKQTYQEAKGTAESDNHPPSFLRTNVTLSQFDKFMETYDVKPGDGMYVAPEDRIAVW